MKVVGTKVTGSVSGVQVIGSVSWTEGSIWIEDIADGRPLDTWLSLGNEIHYGRIVGSSCIEIGGVYLLD